MKRARMYGTLLLLGAAIAAVALIPFPMHVYAPLEVHARDAASVYALVEGVLDEVYVRPGDEVTKGQPLAQLRNIEIEIEIAKLEGELAVFHAQLSGLHQLSFSDRRAEQQVEQVVKTLESLKEQLAKRQEERDKLRLVAPQDGTVLPPPLVEKQSDGTHLAAWSGSPFDRENKGATMKPATKLCQIGDPRRLEARLVIDQGDIDLVAEGQRVEIMLTQLSEYAYVSTIETVSTEDLKMSPTHLSSLHGGSLPTQMDPSGVPRPLSPAFEAIVPLDAPRDAAAQPAHELLRIGLVGRAKISAQPRTLLFRILRYASRTFNFEL